MKKNSKNTKGRIFVATLVFTVFSSLFGGISSQPSAYAVVHELQNPITIQDSSMRSGKRVTYDTIFLGSYPQTEVKASESIYSKLQSSINWDICGDTVIEGVKYRRIKRAESQGGSDLTTWTYDEETDEYIEGTIEPGVGYDGYFHWEDFDTYHYFRYEPIRWRVLDTDGNKALVLSDIAIDARATDIFMWSRPADPIDTKTIDGVYYQFIESTWDNCVLRSWLNSYGSSYNHYKVNCSGSGERSFYNVAFSSGEKSAIMTSHLTNLGGFTTVNDGHTLDYTVGGRDTDDKLFLLSYDDVLGKYGFSFADDVMDEGRKCNVSDYTVALGLCENTDDGIVPRNQWSVQWGLRTATDGVNFWYGSDKYAAVDKTGKRYIHKNPDGSVYSYGDWVGRFQGVRPAMMVDLSSSAYSYAGTYCTDGTYSDGSQYTLGGCEVSHSLRHVDAVDPTYDSVGHKEYWICDRCGKIYEDASGNKETSYFDLAIPKLKVESTSTPRPITPPVATSSSTPTKAPVVGESGSGGGLTDGSSSSGTPTSATFQKPENTPTVAPTTSPTPTPTNEPTPKPEPTIGPSIAPTAPIKTITPDTGYASVSGVRYEVSGNQITVKSVDNRKTVTIHKTVKINGKTYKVTILSKGLFIGKAKVKKVTIETNNIKKINKGAFKGLSKGDVIKLKGSKKQIKKIRKLIVKSGLPKGVEVL